MKKLLALILALAMCFSLVACGGEKADDADKPAASQGSSDKKDDTTEKIETGKSFEDYTLADWEAYGKELMDSGETDYNVLYIPSWAAAEYFQLTYAIWNEQFQEVGWNMEMIGPKDYTVDSQMGVLESALVSGQYDAIILYPIAPEAFKAVKDSNFETYGVPIILHGPAPETECGHYFVQPEDVFAYTGELQYQMICEYVEENWDYFSQYESKGGIPTIMVGQANNPAQNVRVLKCEELLKADGRFNIVEHYENVPGDQALQYGETIALNHPEVEIIACYNDEDAVPMDTAFDTVGGMKDTMRLFGIDGISAVAKMMDAEGKDSRIQGSALANHILYGSEIIMYSCMVGIPAAKEGIIIDGVTERNMEVFMNMQNHVFLTPDTVADYIDWYDILG